MNFGVRTVRKSEEFAITHHGHPEVKKKFQGLCPLEGRKGRKKRGGEGKVGPPPTLKPWLRPWCVGQQVRGRFICSIFIEDAV